MSDFDYILPEHKMEIAKQIEYKWSVQPFGKDSTLFINTPKRPNVWARFWMFLFFGWKFKRIDE